MKSLILILSFICMSCAYPEVYGKHADAVKASNDSISKSWAGYYNYMQSVVNAKTAIKLKEMELESKHSEKPIVEFSPDKDGNFNIAVNQQNNGRMETDIIIPNVPTPSGFISTALPESGFKQAVEFGKAAVYGATAGILGGQIFGTIKDISGSVSNITSVSNSESNQRNTTSKNDISVSDSNNSTKTSTDYSNINTEKTTDNSTTINTETSEKTINYTNTEDNSNNSDNSNKEDNSNNSTTRPAVITPVSYPPVYDGDITE